MKRILIIFILILISPMVLAGTHTVIKNKACPDAWALTDKAIPVIYAHTQDKDSPWGVAPSPDKAEAQTHIQSANPIVTIDGTDLTTENIQDDLLTIASECLVFRNFEVDGSHQTEPINVQQNPATGWIPAALF